MLNFQQPEAPTLGKSLEEHKIRKAFKRGKNTELEILLSILRLTEVN